MNGTKEAYSCTGKNKLSLLTNSVENHRKKNVTVTNHLVIT